MPPTLPVADWPLPCDVCGRVQRLHDLAVTCRPLRNYERSFPARVRFNVVHCPDRWWCRAYAAMPGPWRGRPQLAIEAAR